MKPGALRGMPAFFIRLKQHGVFDLVRGQGLKALALKGSAWTVAGFGAQKVLQLASNLILTRLLFPEVFGIMALVSVVMVGLAMFSDVGIKPAIIQHERGEDPAFLNTAWTIQIFRGFALWAAACVLAWPASLFYGQPILFPLLCTGGVAAAINGFQSTALATANRKLMLGRLTFVQLVGQVITIAVTVALAWLYESVWALAIGNVIGAVVQTLLGHILLPSHAHAIRIERKAVESLIHFGKWIFLSTLITYFSAKGIQAIQGALVSAEILGLIYISSTISWAMGDLASRIIGLVGLPALSKIAREEPNRFPEVLRRIRFWTLAGTLPVIVMLSISSMPLIDLLYDERYAATGRYLAIMAITSAIATLPMLYAQAFTALGDNRMRFVISVILMMGRVTGLSLGFYLADVEGMLVGIGAGTLFAFVIVGYYAHRAGFLALRLDLAAIGFIFLGGWISYAQ